MRMQNVKILESDAADEKVDSWTLQSLLSRHVSRSVPMCRVCDSWQEVTPREENPGGDAIDAAAVPNARFLS